MTESILIGTYGWEHEAWAPDFYPPELPPEWRFCFFSNRIRSVIVPAGAWEHIGPGSAAQWAEDSDPAFRFVIELPPTIVRSTNPATTVSDFSSALGPVRDLTAAFLLPLDTGVSLSRLDALLAQLVALAPVCVRAARHELSDPVRSCLRTHRASICWLPREQKEPEADGTFLVTLMDEGEPRFVRGVLDRLVQWQTGRRGAGLFYTNPQTAPNLAEQTRVLAELMGV